MKQNDVDIWVVVALFAAVVMLSTAWVKTPPKAIPGKPIIGKTMSRKPLDYPPEPQSRVVTRPLVVAPPKQTVIEIMWSNPPPYFPSNSPHQSLLQGTRDFVNWYPVANFPLQSNCAVLLTNPPVGWGSFRVRNQ